MSSRLSELVAFKEYWENRKEKCEEAVKFYNEEITDEINKSNVNDKEETKMKIPTKPYEQLVSYDYNRTGNIRWGVFSHMDGDKVFAHWSNRNRCALSNYTEFIKLDRIVDVVDIVNHEPKEDKLTVAQELSVQQEAANFGYQAIQGIVSANEDKESQKYNVPKKKVPFTFSDFDKSVKRTWKDQSFKDAVSNAALGLTGEAGEVADLIKKANYHGRGFGDAKEGGIEPEMVLDELSDILFYVSAMAQEFGFTLEEVARHNKEKLEKRYEKGFTVEESAQKKDKLKGCIQLNGGIQ